MRALKWSFRSKDVDTVNCEISFTLEHSMILMMIHILLRH